MRTRALETYWAGFATWWIGQLGRRWRKTELGDGLARAALAVGEALVAARHRGAEVRVPLDQLAWLVEIGLRTKFLTAAEHQQVTMAIEVVSGMLGPARREMPVATGSLPPTPA